MIGRRTRPWMSIVAGIVGGAWWHALSSFDPSLLLTVSWNALFAAILLYGTDPLPRVPPPDMRQKDLATGYMGSDECILNFVPLRVETATIRSHELPPAAAHNVATARQPSPRRHLRIQNRQRDFVVTKRCVRGPPGSCDRSGARNRHVCEARRRSFAFANCKRRKRGRRRPIVARGCCTRDQQRPSDLEPPATYSHALRINDQASARAVPARDGGDGEVTCFIPLDCNADACESLGRG